VLIVNRKVTENNSYENERMTGILLFEGRVGKDEGNETVINCNGLRMIAPDTKKTA